MDTDDDELAVQFTVRDGRTAMAALRRYLTYWEQHYEQDQGSTHDPDQIAAVRRDVGHVLWKLEVALTPAGSGLEHSDEAVDPAVH